MRARSSESEAGKPLFHVSSGLATLGPELLALRTALEGRFLAWAAEVAAQPMQFPALIPVEQLEKLDYFKNFPHLAVVASSLQPARMAAHYAAGGNVAGGIPAADLTDGRYVLPSAACYNVYLHLQGSVVTTTPRFVTTVANCFRNESSYDDLRRLWSFSMREIVCIGTSEDVQEHLRASKQRVLDFAAQLGIALEVETASDPFFQPQGPRALMQKLFPQKQEIVYRQSLAIASLNFHRNFFGERCNITTADGQPVFTGCVAFGLERWLYALLDRFAGDVSAALTTLGGPATPVR